MPNQEQFDAMHDAQFCDWWDAHVERVQANASEESTVEAVMEERNAAFNARFA